jgi:cytochrome P450
LPANTQLFVNCYTIQRDPKHWANALEFKSEQFIENPEIDLKGSHIQLLPFCAGIRMCVGMSLTILVAQIGVVRLAQGFNLHFLTTRIEGI